MTLPKRPYCHPGRAFLASSGWLPVSGVAEPKTAPETAPQITPQLTPTACAQQVVQKASEIVTAYSNFLRTEAGLESRPPICLEAIYQHFGMPIPLRAPLVDQQGILVDGNAGLILIKADDPIVRQRFTEGHELMELLFEAIEQLTGPLPWPNATKEKYCDRGAAELLMPAVAFIPQLQKLEVSLHTGQTLAKQYTTSLLATLVHMMQYAPGSYALVVWHRAHSRSDRAAAKQAKPVPAKKLRVWWRVCSAEWTGGFIPKNKSIPRTSLIAKAHQNWQPQTGKEQINLGTQSVMCHTEAMPIQVGNKACVLSLLSALA